jgi:hypothetical protein
MRHVPRKRQPAGLHRVSRQDHAPAGTSGVGRSMGHHRALGVAGIRRLTVMGFSKQRMGSERTAVASKEAGARRALGPQILADAEHLVATWNAQ